MGPFGTPFSTPKIRPQKFMRVPSVRSFAGNEAHKLFSEGLKRFWVGGKMLMLKEFFLRSVCHFCDESGKCGSRTRNIFAGSAKFVWRLEATGVRGKNYENCRLSLTVFMTKGLEDCISHQCEDVFDTGCCWCSFPINSGRGGPRLSCMKWLLLSLVTEFRPIPSAGQAERIAGTDTSVTTPALR